MEPSKEYVEKLRKSIKDNYRVEYNDQEAYEAASNMMGLAEILIDSAEKELARERRLKKEPQGFHLDGTYTCLLCHRHISNEEIWYDKWGIKCLPCQKAIDEGVVPGFAVKEYDSHYSMWQLESKFGIKWQTARKLVRQGKLKARIVTLNGKPYEYIFLRKENPQLIDPDRKSSARKSYDKHQKKKNEAYIKEKEEEWRKEFKKTKKKNTTRL